ncbi:helix-turn-helix domain-containing protein [Nocardioides campestrisoli]|uniref:helix-turn-helix domain-containing protein n=1 Tax=Nocardioides campestrisoli TaxID=2736757 RepID=UPI00163DD77F|nr:helix-turn-helix domain-containing protein [Nocardioides campestrisoli]
MSAAEQNLGHEGRDPDHAAGRDVPSLSLAAGVVEVRRNAGVAAAVGGLSSAVAIAYLARASSTGAVLDWALVAVMGLLAVVWLSSFVDARTPLLVADGQGVRVRLGRSWRGLPWSAVERIEHTPRSGLLRDGRLQVVPRNPELLLAELDRRAARQARVATRLYGGPLALPLGLATRVVADGADATEALGRLVDRGAEVVVVPAARTRREAPAQAAPEDELEADDVLLGPVEALPDAQTPGTDHPDDELDPATDQARPRLRDPRPLLASALTRVSAALPRRSRHDEVEDAEHVEDELEDAGHLEIEHLEIEHEDGEEYSATPEPARETPQPARAEVTRESPSDVTAVLPAAVELVEDTQTWSDRVRPIAREGHPVAPVVFDDFVVEPAADPVVGPELRAARTRIGLSVDQLAERTRIRPHVIEAIEVDDFVPCGGDFYARGHLRTLARVLGVDVTPLLTTYDERYAHAPIDPRRVFEAELATGAHGPIRGTRGGANWSILVAAVMALVLAWSVARLVMDAPVDVDGTPVLNGSGGPHAGSTVVADPVPVVVTAPAGGAKIVVRDSTGAVVFQGALAIGESRTVDASPPVRVQTTDGAVTVGIAGVERGPIGEAGVAAQGTYAAK